MRMLSAISRNGGGDSGLHFLGALGGGPAVSSGPSNLRMPSNKPPGVVHRGALHLAVYIPRAMIVTLAAVSG
jgi:hypothetical protein